uniref:Uncharacterized protein n=1 Tax=Macrostomum lignano TaxID=282301 RepID=A0A1I8J6N1_9PLAT
MASAYYHPWSTRIGSRDYPSSSSRVFTVRPMALRVPRVLQQWQLTIHMLVIELVITSSTQHGQVIARCPQLQTQPS